MNVVIANLTAGGMSGGSRKYVERLVPLLLGHSRISKLQVIVAPQFCDPLREKCGAVVRSWPAGDERARKRFQGLQAQLAAAPPDVVYIPSAHIVRIPHVPTVVMMRNMEPPLIPFWRNPLGESLRNVARLWCARRACQQAEHVIAVSDFVQKFLVGKWRLPQEKISRIYHGIEAPPQRPQAIRPHGWPDADTSMLLFTAGSIRPARGLEDLIGALGALKHMHGLNAQLAIAGQVDRGMDSYAARLRRLAMAAGVADQIHWLGPLNNSEMSWCYYHCHAFVMTSRAEACPNVALEAMVHGCITISADLPPMPEFFPMTARFYRAGDVGRLATQLSHCAAISSAERARWQAAALVRAADFSWEQTAQQTVALLSRIARAGEKGRKALRAAA